MSIPDPVIRLQAGGGGGPCTGRPALEEMTMRTSLLIPALALATTLSIHAQAPQGNTPNTLNLPEGAAQRDGVGGAGHRIHLSCDHRKAQSFSRVTLAAP